MTIDGTCDRMLTAIKDVEGSEISSQPVRSQQEAFQEPSWTAFDRLKSMVKSHPPKMPAEINFGCSDIAGCLFGINNHRKRARLDYQPPSLPFDWQEYSEFAMSDSCRGATEKRSCRMSCVIYLMTALALLRPFVESLYVVAVVAPLWPPTCPSARCRHLREWPL